MRLVSIAKVQPGDIITFSIIGQDCRRILSDNTVLTEFFIKRLKEIGLKYVYITDNRFEDIEVAMPIAAETRVKAINGYKSASDEVIKGKKINEGNIKDIAKLIVDDMKATGIPAIVSNNFYPSDDFLASHAVNTAILAICIGMNLNYNYNQLCDVCLAGFLHDIGRQSNTDDDDDAHAQKGFEALRKAETLSIVSIAVAYQHHENYNGSGFPRGIEGQKISEFARIVSIADYFDILCSRPNMTYEKAYNEVLNDANIKLDPEIVKVFKSAVQIFFNGTIVVLSDGRQGIVQSQNKGYPVRPIIRLFSDSISEYNEQVDLKEELNITINKTLL